ncbi:MAG TPA: hypothetical protein DCY13_17195 [Verrucomicrobiales bacterium]|nr:hypothetical protein [Verrucomicrobiales bacterium]
MNDASNTGSAWLEDEQGRRFDLGGSFAIGRSSACDLSLTDAKISRRHAAIHTQADSEYWLSDFGSANGTFVNQRRIGQPVRLRDGDRLKIGPFEFRFVNPGDSSAGVPTQVTTQQTLIDLKHERRWLMVADIEDSTLLASSLEPHIYRQHVDDWFRRARALIEGEQGAINKFLGDGFLASWPDAEESRARIAATIRGFQTMQAELPFRFRLAVHVGDVILGGVGSAGEEGLSGPEVNFVFRMEKLAGTHGIGVLLSQPASRELEGRVTPGSEHIWEVPGFAGQSRFHEL